MAGLQLIRHRLPKVKGYVDHFTPDQVKAIDALLRETLDPTNAYA